MTRLMDGDRAGMFPFNWVPLREGTTYARHAYTNYDQVSIQLGSPARGDYSRNQSVHCFQWP